MHAEISSPSSGGGGQELESRLRVNRKLLSSIYIGFLFLEFSTPESVNFAVQGLAVSS